MNEVEKFIEELPEKLQDEILQSYLEKFPKEERREVEDILSGKKYPSFMSDIVAKRIFDPDTHKDRLTWLLQKAVGDETLEVLSSARNEGYRESIYSKGGIFDVTAHLSDNRIANIEFQVKAEKFALNRGEIYKADLLLIQYSAKAGEKKTDLDYDRAAGVVQVVLFKNSPAVLKAFSGDEYVHQFVDFVAKSGCAIPMQSPTVYIQLDKCLEQFLRGEDAHKDPEFQKLLVLLADPNERRVREMVKESPALRDITDEVSAMMQEKNTRISMLQEKYAEWDYQAALHYREKKGREEGRAEGREEGREEARIELLMELVEEHIITSDQMFFKLTQSDADKKVIEKNNIAIQNNNTPKI